MIQCAIYYYTTTGIFVSVRHYDTSVDSSPFPQPRQTLFVVDPVAHPYDPGNVCTPTDDECRLLVGLHRRKAPLDADAARVCVIDQKGTVVAVIMACAQNCRPEVHGYPGHIFIHDRTAQVGDIWDGVANRTVVSVRGILLPKHQLHLRAREIHRQRLAA